MSATATTKTLCICIGLFVIVQCALIWNGGHNGVFNSPDANANYHFALRIFEGRPMALPLRVPVSDARQYLFTRSTRIVGDDVLPVGFLGLIILYGLISRVLFINLIPYLTIVAAAIGLFFFYKLINYFFNPAIAFVATILLAIHPAWWEYTNDSLLPNVLFMSLAIIGSAVFVTAAEQSSKRRSVLAGICIALALWVRLSEALWLLPLLVYFSFVPKRKDARRSYYWYFWGSLLGGAIIAWGAQGFFTGSFQLFGYVMPAGTAGSSAIPAPFFFPFGFHPRLIVLHAVQYGLGIFWPYTLALAIALWVSGPELLKRGQRSRSYVLGTAASAAVVMVLYGSWQIADSPDPSAVTIGTSYVRYFLPWYVLVTLPISAAGYWKCMGYISQRMRALSTGILLCCAVVTLYTTAVTGSPESILAKRQTVKGYDTIASWVATNTPSDSIILTAKGDKYLWPNRMVITAFTDSKGLAAAAYYRTTEHRDVYYSGVTFDQIKEAAFDQRLQAVGLQLGHAVYTYADVSFYPLEVLRTNAS